MHSRHNVHVDVRDEDEVSLPPRVPATHWSSVVSPRRTLLGFALGIAMLGALTALLVHHRSNVTVATSLAL